MGRKPSKNPKNVLIQLRQTPDEKAEWRKAADVQGLTLSGFLRRIINNYIKRTKKKR